jgi:hypothetical protein
MLCPAIDLGSRPPLSNKTSQRELPWLDRRYLKACRALTDTSRPVAIKHVIPCPLL